MVPAHRWREFGAGWSLDGTGRIADVLWNSPAFKAGLSQGFTATRPHESIITRG
jgi:hypothetical protein